MSDREDRLNELRKSQGLKPLKKVEPTVDSLIEDLKTKEKSVLEEFLDKPKEEKKKKTTKKEVIKETSEEINTDNLFEAKPEPVNKEEVKEELLNE